MHQAQQRFCFLVCLFPCVCLGFLAFLFCLISCMAQLGPARVAGKIEEFLLLFCLLVHRFLPRMERNYTLSPCSSISGSVTHLGSSWFSNQGQQWQGHSLTGKGKGEAWGTLSCVLASSRCHGSWALVPLGHPDLLCPLPCVAPKLSLVRRTQVTLPDPLHTCECTHTHTCAHMHTCPHTSPTYMHTYTHVSTQSYVFTHMSHTCTYMPPHAHTHTYSQHRCSQVFVDTGHP